MCVEVNAHAMYHVNQRSFSRQLKLFCAMVLGSQTCEKTFRTVRSMNTIVSSVIKFTILGLLHRLHNKYPTNIAKDILFLALIGIVQKKERIVNKTNYYLQLRMLA